MRKRGSLTVFFSLILVFVMTLVFFMAECIRVKSLQTQAEIVTAEAVESGFSEYNKILWDTYKILGVDLGYGTGAVGTGKFSDRIGEFAKTNANQNKYLALNLTRMGVGEVQIDNYGLLTDDEGLPTIYQGIEATNAGQIINVAYEIVDLFNTKFSNSEDNSVDSRVSAGIAAIEGAKSQYAAKQQAKEEAKKKNSNSNDEDEEVDDGTSEPQEVDNNPLHFFSNIRAAITSGILSTAMPEGKTASAANMNIESKPSNRSLNHGNLGTSEDLPLAYKALFGQYLITNMNYYGSDKNHDGMKYEVEYVIAGYNSDKENLSAMATRILGIRLALNLVVAFTNGEMEATALALASLLTGANPLFIEPVKYAILAVWAYAESTVELRAIFNCKKVAWTKSIDNWNLDIDSIGSVLSSNAEAKNVEGGVNYEYYLRMFLMLETKGHLGLRTCDILENALSLHSEYANVKLDNMLFKASVAINYIGHEVFASIFNSGSLNGKKKWNINPYHFKKQKNLSYITI